MWERLLQWDRDTFIYLNSLGIEEYDGFWSLVTHTTTWIPLFILFFLLLLLKYPKKEAIAMILMTVLLFGFVMVFMDLTKNLIARLRPNNNEEISAFIRILINPIDYSFFSGHAANSFAITTLIVLFLRKKLRWVYIFYLWPLLFSLSRIYVGVHYPLDLIAGALVGLLMAVSFYKIYHLFIVPYLGLDRLL
ncbi:phosphatase PAP2 family protein [uncultured Muriicola sp.]|uniref:phosphatase PAP2 family protein n=1 Tax=uncultured Muriicola sp. TaxID=1583102 RepID=UPI002615C713|nr:phosphatase PAP2 family protein [uncultured Muriicola sp.]